MPLVVPRGIVAWMGVAPDGSRVVTRNRTTQDLYTFDWEAFP